MLSKRLKNLKGFLVGDNLGGVFVSNPVNIFYFSDFKTLSPQEREAYLLITKKGVYLFTDPRHSIDYKNLDVRWLVPGQELMSHLQEIISKEKIKRLGFESADLKFNEHQTLSEKLDVELVALQKTVENLRLMKEEEEIANIKKACQVSDQCLREISKTLKVGQTEKEIAFKIEFWLKEKGFDLAFYPIVAADKNAAIPHYDTREGSGKLNKGSSLLIDMGAKYKNYCSDITRVFSFGKPTSEFATMYEKLLEAQGETIRSLRHSRPDRESADPRFREDDGVSAKEIDAFCRGLLKQKGLPNFLHSTGHGVGLEVHESPSISQKSKDTLLDDQVFTIEPGVYIDGQYGARIEDTVLLTKRGVEVLTKFPKNLQII